MTNLSFNGLPLNFVNYNENDDDLQSELQDFFLGLKQLKADELSELMYLEDDPTDPRLNTKVERLREEMKILEMLHRSVEIDVIQDSEETLGEVIPLRRQ